MNIESLLVSGVEKAFSLLREAVFLGTYHRNNSGYGTGDYDPVTDTVIGAQIIPNVRMIPLAVETTDLAGTIVMVTDQKILIPGVDLDFDPTTSDYLKVRGEEYNIVRYKSVPTGALHILFCRAR